MGCPGNPQLAFKLQQELWASPKTQGLGKGSRPPQHPLLFVSIVHAGEAGRTLSRATRQDAILPRAQGIPCGGRTNREVTQEPGYGSSMAPHPPIASLQRPSPQGTSPPGRPCPVALFPALQVTNLCGSPQIQRELGFP